MYGILFRSKRNGAAGDNMQQEDEECTMGRENGGSHSPTPKWIEGNLGNEEREILK